MVSELLLRNSENQVYKQLPVNGHWGNVGVSQGVEELELSLS